MQVGTPDFWNRRGIGLWRGHFFSGPMQNRCCSVRINKRPPEIAGDARQLSPSEFLAFTTNSGPASMTYVVPASLVQYTLPSPATGDAVNLPSRRSRYCNLPVLASRHDRMPSSL